MRKAQRRACSFMLAHSIRTIVVAILPHSYIRHLIPGAEITEIRRIKHKWDHIRRINRSSTGTGTCPVYIASCCCCSHHAWVSMHGEGLLMSRGLLPGLLVLLQHPKLTCSTEKH